MTHEIVKTENYLLVVDDSEIKKGDWFYNRVLSQSIKVQGVWLDKVDNLNSNLETFKVIAHLPLNNSPILEGVDVLPPLDNIRYDFAEMFYNILKATYPRFDEWVEAIEYNKAREKYKFTEEDIENAFNSGRGYGVPDDIRDLNSFMKSLSQPKMPIAFECEMEYKFPSGREYVQPNPDYLPKTTTNSQGQTQWVGKYIYA
jgi:hypothetical protein